MNPLYVTLALVASHAIVAVGCWWWGHYGGRSIGKVQSDAAHAVDLAKTAVASGVASVAQAVADKAGGK